MTWLAGVDGCRAGWFRVARETTSGALAFEVLEEADALMTAPAGTERADGSGKAGPARPPRVVAIDIPIGLPDAGPRACDRSARQLLGSPRGRSVFPAPVRPALGARSHAEACALTERADGRRVSQQAWNLTAKIRAVDALLARDSRARRRLREVHPELCFWAWNGRRPMEAPKKRAAGRAERLRLAEAWLGPGLLSRARGGHARAALADDDILDAVAALWTACRIAGGAAEAIPAGRPPRDAAGRPMEIVF